MRNSATSTHAEDTRPALAMHAEPAVGTAALWRKKAAEQLDASDLFAIRDLLKKAILLNDPKWPEARNGSAADAIAVAVATWPVRAVTQRTDLVMTALLCAAMEGSAAAAVVLSHVLRQLPDANKRHKRIAASWLAKNLRAALAKRARRPSAPTRLLLKSACVDGGGRPQ
jgi:hypothetical protein